MMPSKDRMCHCTGFARSCRELVTSEACGRWSKIEGTHPQTGAPLDQWGCDDDHEKLLLMNIARHVVGTQAATESFRNVVVKQYEHSVAQSLAPPMHPQMRVIEHKDDAA